MQKGAKVWSNEMRYLCKEEWAYSSFKPVYITILVIKSVVIDIPLFRLGNKNLHTTISVMLLVFNSKSLASKLLSYGSLNRNFSVQFELVDDIGQEVLLAGRDSLQHSLVLLILLYHHLRKLAG